MFFLSYKIVLIKLFLEPAIFMGQYRYTLVRCIMRAVGRLSHEYYSIIFLSKGDLATYTVLLL